MPTGVRMCWLRCFGMIVLLAGGCSDDESPQRDGGGDLSAADGSVGDGSAGDATAAGDLGAGDGPAGSDLGSDGSGAWDPCPALGAPTGATVQVTPAQAGDLDEIVANAASGTTIVLQAGTYALDGAWLNFRTANVTLRSASGNRDDVVIDGQYVTTEIVVIRADDVTIADLTLKRAKDHLVHASGGATATIKNTRLYNLKLIDSGEQFVKVNVADDVHYVDDGQLACSSLEMTATGRDNVETAHGGGCYTGGIDTHGGWGWVVRDNTFEGIYCDKGGLAEHAVHFWSASRDTLVERNVIIDCARGVGFGLPQEGRSRAYPDNPYSEVSGYIGHYDGLIRNNVIHVSDQVAPYYDTGIELAQARGARVYHNTVVTQPTFSSIDCRWANTQAEVRNNITYRITTRNEAQATQDHNLQRKADIDGGDSWALDSVFVEPDAANYRLKSSDVRAANQGVQVGQAGSDLDGNTHDHGLADLGAYERQP